MCPRLRRRSVTVLLLGVGVGVTAGCGPDPIPGTEVGESAHFRFFIDPDRADDLSADPQGTKRLAELETDFADKRTMLGTPDGRKIDYHLLTPAHVAAVCGFTEFSTSDGESACFLEDQMAIAAAYVPHQHELIHAYMTLVAPGSRPVPFLVEGIAEAIGCSRPGIDRTWQVAWQQATIGTAADPDEYVYSEGGLFARTLIRTQGIDAYLRYFRQAPARRDWALFAANFSAFWGMSLDDAWTAMHTVSPGDSETDVEICPCSLAPAPTDGRPITNDRAKHPYWTLPDTFGSSVAVTVPSGDLVWLQDCAGIAPEIRTFYTGSPVGAPVVAEGVVAIVEVPDARPRYLLPPIGTLSVGRFLADDCAAAEPYALSENFLGGGHLWILANQTTAAARTTHATLQVSVATKVATETGYRATICNGCAFDQGSCPVELSRSLNPGPVPIAPGTLNVEFVLARSWLWAGLPTQAIGDLMFGN